MKYTFTLAATAAALFALSTAEAKHNDNPRGYIGNVGLGKWESAYKKAVAFTDSLTLEQKASIVTSGNASSNVDSFPGIVISDGQSGPASQWFVTGWSQPAAVTMTWDKQAMYDQAKAIGVEFKIRGIHVVDGPTSAPLGRVAWGGRAAEAFAFDSYLNGIAFGLSSKAEIDAGVIPSGKHFLLYEQETNRTDVNANSLGLESYDAIITDKALHETYLAPWYDAVKGGIGTAMCAMNLVNGSYSCENEPLLMGLLKEEIGFPGFVVPDINGQKTLNGSANGGLDWTNQLWDVSNVMDLVESGEVSHARLDDMVIRNTIGWYFIHADEHFPSEAESDEFRPVPRKHRKLVRENGAKSIVLLKNKHHALPLSAPKTLSIFGAHAGPAVQGPAPGTNIFSQTPDTYQGHMASSGAAGAAELPYIVTPFQALTERAAEDGTQLRWILNDTYTPGSVAFGTTPSIDSYSQDAEACLVFLNAYGGEGSDRTELRNKDQDDLVKTVASNCNNTIVVINAVGPRILDSWIENANVTGVLYGAPLGQESGHSIIDVLYGDVNPSAALTYTIAKDEADYVARPCLTLECPYKEGNYIDYKHFDREDIEPRFEFGFGLSYTDFEYSTLKITSKAKSGHATGARMVGGRADLWDEVVTVTVEVANTGDVDGAHVVQLYLTFPDEADQPIRQLRSFEKVDLKKGVATSVKLGLRQRDLSYWDVEAQEWKVPAGEFVVNVGASSRDFGQTGSFTVR